MAVCRPGTRQLLASLHVAVTQLALPAGVGQSVTLYEVQGPPLVGGVMTRSADVGLSGVALAMTGWVIAGVATVAGAEGMVAVPLASMPTACKGNQAHAVILCSADVALHSANSCK